MESSKPSARVKKHGLWLLVWLWLVLISNVIVAIAHLGAVISPQLSPLQGATEITPSWALVMLGLLGVVNIVSAILLIRFKVSGFYAIVFVAAIAFVINLVIGIDIVRSLLGFVGPAILYFLMKPRWSLFER
ncbi:hypothetical protein HON52_04385 [Candidatus Uhrbacteria bacterium]|jgi:hypothetical protein|nr:hypothetical protein [Candidatus Uhrbacteria bacterium]